MTLIEHVQMEFPFTRVGYMQNRAILQDKYLQQSYQVNNMYLADANRPTLSFVQFELSDTGRMYMGFFSQVYSKTERELRELL